MALGSAGECGTTSRRSREWLESTPKYLSKCQRGGGTEATSRTKRSSGSSTTARVGSGKTKVITTRIAKLIEGLPRKRFRVLGLTFTTKAADEMRSRIDGMVTDGRDRVQLGTFHSFAADVLRQHGSHIGFRPDFVILNQAGDREAVLLDAIRDCASQGVETDETDLLRPLLDRLLDVRMSADDVRNRVRDPDLADKASARSPNTA